MPKKFKFSLDAVENLREHKVEISKNSLLQVTSLRIANDSEMNRLVELRDELLRQPVKGSHLSEQLHSRSHIRLLDTQIEKRLKERQRLLEIENIKRKDYNSKLQEKDAIIKIKERQKEDYLYNINKEENILMEEIALQRYNPEQFT